MTVEPPLNESSAAAWRQRATSFDDTAVAYEYGRPAYPSAAIDWWEAQGAQLRAGARVLDLAAGTGKLSRLLVARGCEVVAVEPLANMRAELADAVPDVEVLEGTAEIIPLPDRSVDCVVVGQAFHWFDGPRAMAEITRVLRPAGGLGLIWNDDDTSVAWVEQYSEQKHRVGRVDTRHNWAELAAKWFRHVAETELGWSETTTRERLLANALSRSYISMLPAHERPAALEPLATLLADQPEPIEFPMNTYVCWCAQPIS